MPMSALCPYQAQSQKISYRAYSHLAFLAVPPPGGGRLAVQKQRVPVLLINFRKKSELQYSFMLFGIYLYS